MAPHRSDAADAGGRGRATAPAHPLLGRWACEHSRCGAIKAQPRLSAQIRPCGHSGRRARRLAVATPLNDSLSLSLSVSVCLSLSVCLCVCVSVCLCRCVAASLWLCVFLSLSIDCIVHGMYGHCYLGQVLVPPCCTGGLLNAAASGSLAARSLSLSLSVSLSLCLCLSLSLSLSLSVSLSVSLSLGFIIMV